MISIIHAVATSGQPNKLRSDNEKRLDHQQMPLVAYQVIEEAIEDLRPNSAHKGIDHRSHEMSHDTDAHTGSRIQARRLKMGMSHSGLTDKLGIAFQQVQKYESGANRISGNRIWQACDALDVEPNDFLKGLGGTDALAPFPKRAVSKRVTLNLFQAFSGISDEDTRGQIVNLAQARAKQSGTTPTGAAR